MVCDVILCVCDVIMSPWLLDISTGLLGGSDWLTDGSSEEGYPGGKYPTGGVTLDFLSERQKHRF